MTNPREMARRFGGGDAPRRRLSVAQARERAARSCGVTVDDLTEPREHAWGWSFTLAEPGAGPVFVDGDAGLVATSELGENERIATLYARGPRGVPPWSPPRGRAWWDAVRTALGWSSRR